MRKNIGILSFRLGGVDGVSIEAAKWKWGFSELGWNPITIAGDGNVDRTIQGIGIPTPENASQALDVAGLKDALADLDVVVIENLCSLPLNKEARTATFHLLENRPAIFHHHDLPWQRSWSIDEPAPMDTAAWRHVVINEMSQIELLERNISSVLLYNSFIPHPVLGDRTRARADIRVQLDERVVLQPTRAIERKNVEGGIRFAEKIDATYWLLGPPEDGFDMKLHDLLLSANCRVVHSSMTSIADAYAAADVIVMPSIFEGFGNPTLESATYRKPLAIYHYQVAKELLKFGFHWFGLDQSAEVSSFLDNPDESLLDHNASIVESHFNLGHLPKKLEKLLTSL